MKQDIRSEWLRAQDRVIVPHDGSSEGNEGDVIVYAKETLVNGWNTWALVRGKGKHIREVGAAYRRTRNGLRYVGDLRDDVLTIRIFAALKQGVTFGQPMELTCQYDLEEWLVLYGKPTTTDAGRMEIKDKR